jgi:hypothetical protein
MAIDPLGAFQREYSASSQGRYEVVSGSAILVGILAVGIFALTHSKPGQLWIGILLIGGLAGALGVYIYGGIRKLGRRILFHADGMILREGGRTDIFRWEEVASVTGMLPVSFRGTPVHIGGPMTIELRDGRRFRLAHGYADPDVLANFIHDKVLACLLPPALAALQRGEAVSMGPLQLDRAGLRHGEQSLPWSEFQGCSFTADDLTILRAGGQPWTTLKIAQVPNANLLLSLARNPRPA